MRQKLLGRAAGLAVVRIEALYKMTSGDGGSSGGGGRSARGRPRGRGGRGRGGGGRGSGGGGDGGESFTFAGRWYCLPEETRVGRKVHLEMTPERYMPSVLWRLVVGEQPVLSVTLPGLLTPHFPASTGMSTADADSHHVTPFAAAPQRAGAFPDAADGHGTGGRHTAAPLHRVCSRRLCRRRRQR